MQSREECPVGPPPDHYTVAIICSLGCQLNAIECMFDWCFQTPRIDQIHDNNAYTCGRINDHNVVVASKGLFETGVVNASVQIGSLKHSFKQLKTTIVLGTGGGIPYHPPKSNPMDDIHLGDVVVGWAGPGRESLVQWDSGKHEWDGFKVISSLDFPSQRLRSGLGKLQANRERYGNSMFKENLDRCIGAYPSKFYRPKPESDMLFKSAYVHPPKNSSCQECDVEKIVDRPKRADAAEVKVHYGTIASGSAVVKSAKLRDSVRNETGALCIEMSAAGIATGHDINPLAIKGISDYADSHKTDDMAAWRSYAAATAAAYVRELLYNMDPGLLIEVRHDQPRLSNSRNIEKRNQKITEFLRELHEYAWPGGDSYESSKDRVRCPEEGTCKWFINHPKFKAWESLDSSGSGSPLLLLTAYPGSGKSVLSKHLIETILPRPRDRVVCYFFFKDDFEHQKSATRAVCTLLHRLLSISESRGRTSLANSALQRFESFGQKSFFGSFSILWNTFIDVALDNDTGEVICILDALDECWSEDRNELIKAINRFYEDQTQSVQKSSCIKFFLTSRPYGDIIQSQFSHLWGRQLLEIRLAGEEDDVADAIEEEIQIVVDKRITHICDVFHLSKATTRLMKENLGNAPGRTYLWITLVFDDLLQKTHNINRRYIENFVKNSPKSVDDAYEKILNRPKMQDPGSQDTGRTRNILQMVIAATRPLTLREMSIALPFTECELSDSISADDIETVDRTWDIIRDLCGLLVIRVDDRLYLLHQTVREFLLLNSQNANNGEVYPSSSNHWKHSIDLRDANAVLAQTCISYLHCNFAKTDNSLFVYSANYWVVHYKQSRTRFQAKTVEKTRDLCLPEKCTQWATSQSLNGDIPKFGPPVSLAAALGLDRAVGMFLREQHSTSINLQIDEKYSQTALHWASWRGHIDVVQLLLDKEASIDIANKWGETPLHKASRKGHVDIVRLLLEKGASIDIADRVGETALYKASDYGNVDVVRLLLDKGANINAADEGGQTPLHQASLHGHVDVVRLLLDKGANINAIDDSGQTPLHQASLHGHVDVVRLLLDKSTNINAADDSGQTPLHQASLLGKLDVIRLLLERGADTSKKDRAGGSALKIAAYHDDEAMEQLFLDHGALEP